MNNQRVLTCAVICVFVYISTRAQPIRSIDWHVFPDTGIVDVDEMKMYGGFDYALRGFGNGPESNHNDAYNLSVHDDIAGLSTGRWAKVLSRKWPGPSTVHTFGKSVRAVNAGNATPFSYEECWIDIPLWIPEEWTTHNQGKLGYSLSNPFGTRPGTNPTDSFEMLLHYFSGNNMKKNKREAPWYSVNPSGPFEEQDMLIGLDVYGGDKRINTHFSEPVFFKESLGDTVRKVFQKQRHYILRAHIKLNTPGIADGELEGWYSEDGGVNWTKSIEVLDFNWRGEEQFNFESEGFVAFRGGNGPGFEVGGDSSLSQNTGVYNEPQDTWYYLGKIDVYTEDPFTTSLYNQQSRISNLEIQCVPNPNQGYFNIISNTTIQRINQQIVIYNQLGNEVYRTANTGNIMDISNMPKGVYSAVLYFDDTPVAQTKIILSDRDQ